MTITRQGLRLDASDRGRRDERPGDRRGQGASRQLVMGSPMPSRHSASTFIVEAADAIRKDSNGALDILFLADSQLGSEADMQRQLRAGGIQFLVASCSSLQNLAGVAGMPGVAYAFKDYSQVWAALDGDLGSLTREALARLGMVAFKCLDNGFRNVTTSTRAINGVGDLRGSKFACRRARCSPRCSNRSAHRRRPSASASCIRHCRPGSSTGWKIRWCSSRR